MKKKILSVGFPGFPLGLAQVQRQLMLAKAMVLEGYEVTVLCRYGIHRPEDQIAARGVSESIKYLYCSGDSVRPKSYIKRNVLKLYGLINEFRIILEFSRSKELAGILISTNTFHNIFLYMLAGKFAGAEMVIDNVEHWTSISSFRGFIRIEKLLYDKYYHVFFDNIICISDFLISKIRKPEKKKILKIPAITDFDKFRKTNYSDRYFVGRYFLYCGSDFYFDVICFVVSSFERFNNSEIQLLIISNNTDRIRSLIAGNRKKDSIKLISNLPYEDLINLYLFSEGLILPMRDSDQDKARFPHKISEYCASNRPIITNKIGEIGNYFNESNAYICAEYTEQYFADAMNLVISDSSRAESVAKNSYITGNDHFNYKSYAKTLSSLFR